MSDQGDTPIERHRARVRKAVERFVDPRVRRDLVRESVANAAEATDIAAQLARKLEASEQLARSIDEARDQLGRELRQTGIRVSHALRFLDRALAENPNLGADVYLGGAVSELRSVSCANPAPVDPFREVVEGLVNQFGIVAGGKLHAGGLSALEAAFEVLGLDDPCEAPAHLVCDEDGCGAAASCGTPTEEKYRRTCFEHVPHQERRVRSRRQDRANQSGAWPHRRSGGDRRRRRA